MGTVLLVDVMDNGSMYTSFSFDVEGQGIADVKWANLSRQFIVTTTKGKVLHGYLFKNNWKIEEISKNYAPISHYVAW